MKKLIKNRRLTALLLAFVLILSSVVFAFAQATDPNSGNATENTNTEQNTAPGNAAPNSNTEQNSNTAPSDNGENVETIDEEAMRLEQERLEAIHNKRMRIYTVVSVVVLVAIGIGIAEKKRGR